MSPACLVMLTLVLTLQSTPPPSLTCRVPCFLFVNDTAQLAGRVLCLRFPLWGLWGIHKQVE